MVKEALSLSQTIMEPGTKEKIVEKINQAPGQKPPEKARLASLDQFRGLAIVLMVLANFMGGVSRVPAWLKHAPDIGLTVIDLIAPFFIFAIGLTFGLSYRRRAARDGGWKTARHFTTRFAILIAVGLVFSFFENYFGVSSGWVLWEVLAAIGFAGLVTLPTLRLRTSVRLLIGLALLAGYQLLLDRFWLQTVLHSPHGGVLGAIDWSAMLILATVLADLFHQPGPRRWIFPLAGAACLAAGAAVALVAPVSKNRVSASYVLISLGASALLFFLFYWINDRMNWRAPLLTAWGKNPLALYLLHQLLLGFYVLPGIAAWYADAPVWLTVLQGAALLAALSLIAKSFEHRGWILSL
jgi:predicted acyltransferase